MNRKLVCLGSLVFFSLTLGLQSHLYAADNEVGIPFSPKSYEMTSESSLIDFIESHKADEKIGFEISDRSANLKTSSLEYITEKNRTLRVYQTILKSGVKPSRISISTASSKSNNVSIFAKEGIDSPIAQLPAASESDQNENSFKILFDSASAVPKFSSNDELAKFLSGFGKGNRDAVVLEGRTDSVGNANYNRALAELRALSVFKLLVDNGLPPYRVDTKAVAQSSNPGKGKASADDRAVVVKWTENKAIAAEAAVIEKPVEVEQPPVVAPVEPAPVVESKPVAKVEESPKSESSLGTIDLVVAAGALIPGGELSKHAKTSASWGLGVGKAFWAEQGREVRGTILYHGNASTMVMPLSKPKNLL
ncbi:MAG: OmpA family protein [Proteobacteria bacterium]|nr:MAG: OmpA family protein [Pseudomonadota bacterium]